MSLRLGPRGFFWMASAASMALIAPSVSAQSVDYGSMKDLFGEPITTSATGTPKRASEAPVTMIIIEQEQVRRSPATNIAALLRDYAGVDVTQQGADSYDVGIRGGNAPFNPTLLVMVNGRQVYADHFGFVIWNTIPVELDEIQQIEVVKGPNGAIFGFNAAVGVVNIITKNPLYDEGASFSAEYGLDNEMRFSGSLRAKLTDTIALRFSAGHDEQDGLTPDAGETYLSAGVEVPYGREALLRQNTASPKAQNAAVELAMQLSSKSQLFIEGSYAESSNFARASSRLPLELGNEWYSIKGRLSVDSDWGLIDATVYYNTLDQENDFGFDGIIDNVFENDVFVVQLQDSLQVSPKTTLRLSTEYRHNTFEATPGLGGEISFDLVAGGVLLEHKLSNTITATGAVRVDHVALDQSGSIEPDIPFTNADFDRNITDYTLNGAITYTPTSKDAVRVIYGRGLQLPPHMVLGVASPAPFGFFAGDPTLDPTVVNNYEVAYDRKIDGINGQLRTAFFYREVNGYNLFPFRVNLVPPEVPVPVAQSEEIGDFDSLGFELSLNGEEGDFRWGINYTFTDIDEDLTGNVDGALFQRTAAAFEAQTPRHKINGQLSYQSGPLTVSLYARYRSGTGELGGLALPDGFPVLDFGSSFAVDGRVSYMVQDGVELYISGENVTDNAAMTSSILPGEARVRGGVRFVF